MRKIYFFGILRLLSFLGGTIILNTKPEKKKKSSIFIYYIILLVVILIVSYVILPKMLEPEYKEISFSEFVNMIETDQAEQVEVTASKYTLKPKNFKETTHATLPEISIMFFTKVPSCYHY